MQHFLPGSSKSSFFFFRASFHKIWLNLFHACPLEAGLTLMMGGRTVEGGNRARLTGEGFVRAHRDRGNTPEPGAMGSKFWEFTLGPVGTATEEPGLRERGMALAWRAKGGGSIRENGHKGSREGTGSWKALVDPDTKAPGAMDYKMDMDRRHTRMEVRIQLHPLY